MVALVAGAYNANIHCLRLLGSAAVIKRPYDAAAVALLTLVGSLFTASGCRMSRLSGERALERFVAGRAWRATATMTLE